MAELLSLLIELDLFADRFQGAHILVHIDNQNARSWVNNQTSPVPSTMLLICELVHLSIMHNVRVKAAYIEIVLNVQADFLSHLQVRKFKQYQGPGKYVEESHNLRVSTSIWPGLEDVL